MAFVITWAHRDRVQQTDQAIEWVADSIGPEPGTSYALQVHNGSSALVAEKLDIAGDTATVTTDDTGPLTFSLWSQCRGAASLRTVRWTESQAVPDAGQGTAIDAPTFTGEPTIPDQPHGEPLVASNITPPVQLTDSSDADFVYSS